MERRFGAVAIQSLHAPFYCGAMEYDSRSRAAPAAFQPAGNRRSFRHAEKLIPGRLAVYLWKNGHSKQRALSKWVYCNKKATHTDFFIYEYKLHRAYARSAGAYGKYHEVDSRSLLASQ